MMADAELLYCARRAGEASDHRTKWALLQEYITRHWEARC